MKCDRCGDNITQPIFNPERRWAYDIAIGHKGWDENANDCYILCDDCAVEFRRFFVAFIADNVESAGQ